MLGVALLFSAAALGCARAEQRRPNLIVVLTDDHGYADLGIQDVVKDVKTPNLDALARDGVRFTRGYVSAPQCVPSRAGLLTGRYQTRFGVERNRSGALPLTERTLADRLQASGYLTGMVGKWHLALGRGADYAPGRRGFDEYFTGANAAYQANFDLAGKSLPNPPQTVVDRRYRIDVQTDAALAFLERRVSDPRQPFFLYLAYVAPHFPLEPAEPYFSRFPDVEDETRRMGLASIAAMDDGIGRIRGFLREHGLEENTLWFVLSDNGAPLRRESWNGSRNDPLLGQKGMLTDGGIRVPFLAAWKGVLPRGEVESRAVSALDVAATALALAGEKTDPELDGVNLMPMLTGQSTAAPHDLLYWRWRSQAAVFDGRWKLIYLAPDHWLLFDHSADQPETQDVAALHPEVVARLRAHLEAWAAEQQPPGLPRELIRPDRILYDAHLKLFGGETTR
jgi:arylsulfatase A-like enzyme